MKRPALTSCSVRPARRALSAAIATAALLGGCAALQIDVDVYKGPLVHDEDTQIQQLASIAMSGKAVMLLQRNRWLTDVNAQWSDDDTGPRGVRSRRASAAEWAAFASPSHCKDKIGQCRNARLLNDMLSAYEDRSDPGLVQPTEAVSENYLAYKRARSASLDNKRSDKERAGHWKDANEALRLTWGALVDLLQDAKRPVADEETVRIYRDVERQTADILGRLTEPAVLLCSTDLPLKGELLLAKKPMQEALNVSSINRMAAEAASLRASSMLGTALRLAAAEHLPALRSAMDMTVPMRHNAAGHIEGCGNSDSAMVARSSASKAPQLDAMHSGASTSQVVSHIGVQREGTGSKDDALDAELKEIDVMVGSLLQIGASGFDRGRPRFGLDRLADDAALDRFSDRSKGRDDVNSLAHSRQVEQLQDSVVDLASRMQFLAVNLRLVDGATSDANQAFKSTLESIANTLLVLAEDQRRQRAHHDQQKKFSGAEHQAATAAFQVDPARRFDQLLAALDDRKTKTRKLEAEDLLLVTERERGGTAVNTAQTKKEKAQREVEEADAHRAAMTALYITLHAVPPPTVPKAERDALAASKDSVQWRTDRDKFDQAWATLPAKVSTEAVRAKLESSLTAEINEGLSPATAAEPRMVRLQAAVAALRPLTTTASQELDRAAAVKGFRERVTTAVQLSIESAATKLTSLASTEQALKDAADKSAKLAGAPGSKLSASGEIFTSARLEAAAALVSAQRTPVLTAALAEKSATDARELGNLTRQLLEAAQKLAAADKKAAYDDAAQLVNDWAVRAPAALKFGGAATDSPLKTLDRVEAYLSYRRIEALQRGDTSSKNAQELDNALAALTQRRERMSYLRPASMYLRSALATTSQQNDPRLEWGNLLTATLKRLLGGRSENDKQAAAVRGELDKSFWQSVNQVRVSAAGDSNFAIAKDDVGNWYVKAMGSDSAKMISAAKNLALYNLGGRVDANFMRMDELRNKSDRNAQDNRELDDLLDRKNGASATAYGNTLQVFEANHAKAVRALLSDVQDDLKIMALHTTLQARWAATYAASTTRLAAVNASLKAAPVQQLHDKAMTAAEDGMVGTAGTTPSSALIDTLGLLAQQRSLLKSQVTGMVSLTDSEMTAVTERQSLVDKTAADLATLQDQRVKLAEELARLRKELGASPSAPNNALQAQVDEQQRLLNVQGEQIGRQHADGITAQKLLKEAVAALATARSAQTQALNDVDLVWQKYVHGVASRQLRAVEEMETAARVVSQGVQGVPGKTAKP